MRYIILTLTILFGLSSFSQEFEVRDMQVDSGPTSLQGTFKIIKPVLVLEAKGTPQDLYTKTLNWVNETYKNPDEVIKAKIEGEYIRLNGYVSNLIQLSALTTDFYDVRYSLEIRFRENRFRYKVTKMESYMPRSEVAVGGWFTESFSFRVAKAKGKPNRKTGVRSFGKFDKDAGANYRKVKAYFENLGVSIQEYILKNDGAYDDSDDDW